MLKSKGKFYMLAPKKPADKVDNVKVDYHRNGVSGVPFHIIAFDTDDTGVIKHMIGIVFEEQGYCAVFDRELLGQGIIAFFENSWRGDYFEPALRAEISKYQQELTDKFAKNVT